MNFSKLNFAEIRQIGREAIAAEVRCGQCSELLEDPDSAVPFGAVKVCQGCKDAYAQSLVEGGAPITQDERILRQYIDTENNLQTLGALFGFSAAFSGFNLYRAIFPPAWILNSEGYNIGHIVYQALHAPLSLAMMVCLLQLRPTIRPLSLGLGAASLLNLLIEISHPTPVKFVSLAFYAFVIYGTYHPKSRFVCTPEYHELKKRNPDVKQQEAKTSTTTWVLAGILLVVLIAVVFFISTAGAGH